MVTVNLELTEMVSSKEVSSFNDIYLKFNSFNGMDQICLKRMMFCLPLG